MLFNFSFADEFKYSVIKIACHDPATITPVDVCHSFKVPKMLKSLSSPLEQGQLSGAKVASPKGKKSKDILKTSWKMRKLRAGNKHSNPCLNILHLEFKQTCASDT